MFNITKTMEISGSHCLDLPYDSPCKRIHGHNWNITITIEASQLNKQNMIIDFAEIKKIVYKLDHNHLNDIMKGENPTAEEIAFWLGMKIHHYLIMETPSSMGAKVKEVEVQESEGNVAKWTP